ncbi:hypothetical protein ACSZMN_20955 [Aeromonas veronii]
MKIDNLLMLFLLCCSFVVNSATISSDRKKITSDSIGIETIIDLDHPLSTPIEVNNITPLNQLISWNESWYRLNNIPIGLRLTADKPTDVNVSVIDDFFYCDFDGMIVDKNFNAHMLQMTEYIYRVDGNEINGAYQLPLNRWYMVTKDWFSADVNIIATSPFIKSEFLPQVRRVGGTCQGNITILVSKG